jgi:hypothetical protein
MKLKTWVFNTKLYSFFCIDEKSLNQKMGNITPPTPSLYNNKHATWVVYNIL